MLVSSRQKVVVVFTTFKLVALLQEAGGPVNTDNWGGTRHLASAPKISPFLSARHRIVSSRFVYRWPEIALTSLISGRGVGARVGRSSVPPWEAHLATFSRFHLLHLGLALYLPHLLHLISPRCRFTWTLTGRQGQGAASSRVCAPPSIDQRHNF